MVQIVYSQVLLHHYFLSHGNFTVPLTLTIVTLSPTFSFINYKLRLNKLHQYVACQLKFFNNNQNNNLCQPFHVCFKKAKHTLKSYGVQTARFLKYVLPFYNIIHKRVNSTFHRKGKGRVLLLSWVFFMDVEHNFWQIFSQACYINWNKNQVMTYPVTLGKEN